MAAPSLAAAFPLDSPAYVSAGAIQDAQSQLVKLGYLRHGAYVDGVADRRTEAAVREFQSSHHLPVTGVLDWETVALMHGHTGPGTLALAQGPAAAARSSRGGASESAGRATRNAGASATGQDVASREMPRTAGSIPLIAALGGALATIGFALWRGQRG